MDNYRSTGSAFPLRNSNIFKYLPPSNHLILSHVKSNHIPNFISINNRRIDLTPGVFVSFHRYHRLLSSPSSSNRVIQKQVKFITKKSSRAKNDRSLIAHKVKKKLSRRDLSHQLTEFIRMDNSHSCGLRTSSTSVVRSRLL